MTRSLGDRVKNWMTFNEPYVSAVLGYQLGVHAPGHTSLPEALAAAHHHLLSHGQAVSVIRENAADANVGIVLNLSPFYPASPSIADRKKTTWHDGNLNRWYLDPLVGRGYPQDIVGSFQVPMDFLQPGDMDVIAEPIDYLGVNYYTRAIIRSDEISEAENEPPVVFRGDEITEMGWEVFPEGLYQILGRLHFDYHFPAIYITENGAAFPDEVGKGGGVNDVPRLSYIKRHLHQCYQAIEIGVPLKGYFVWSLFDNFEWAHGYRPRFGIYHVDYETLNRTPKSSALWYRDVIQNNGIIEE
jgi:beta-glucosidase